MKKDPEYDWKDQSLATHNRKACFFMFSVEDWRDREQEVITKHPAWRLHTLNFATKKNSGERVLEWRGDTNLEPAESREDKAMFGVPNIVPGSSGDRRRQEKGGWPWCPNFFGLGHQKSGTTTVTVLL